MHARVRVYACAPRRRPTLLVPNRLQPVCKSTPMHVRQQSVYLIDYGMADKLEFDEDTHEFVPQSKGSNGHGDTQSWPI